MTRIALSESAAPARILAAARRLGVDIRIARKRRQLRQEDLARAAGITVPTLRRVESGSLGTGLGAYLAVLWAMGLDERVSALVDPASDIEGETLEAARRGRRVRLARTISDDF